MKYLYAYTDRSKVKGSVGVRELYFPSTQHIRGFKLGTKEVLTNNPRNATKWQKDHNYSGQSSDTKSSTASTETVYQDAKIYQDN